VKVIRITIDFATRRMSDGKRLPIAGKKRETGGRALSAVPIRNIKDVSVSVLEISMIAAQYPNDFDRIFAGTRQ
jgi:hypothetical protein